MIFFAKPLANFDGFHLSYCAAEPLGRVLNSWFCMSGLPDLGGTTEVLKTLLTNQICQNTAPSFDHFSRQLTSSMSASHPVRDFARSPKPATVCLKFHHKAKLTAIWLIDELKF